jgi:site-specific DNA recombinase
VDRATFAAVQAQLRRNKEESTRNNSRPKLYLLRGGFVRCGYCGRSVCARLRTERTGT